MTFASLDYFIIVARERSFTRAAAQLHITQQTLSAHIAALEKELGCALLHRRIPLELTYGGEVFLQYAKDIQTRRGAMLRELGDIAHNEKGRLRIGIAHTRGRAIMPELISRFQGRYPLVQIQLVEATNDALHTKLLNGEIDLAIANFPKGLPGVVLQDFYQEEVVLLVADGLLQEIYGEDKAVVLAEAAERGDLGRLKDCPFVFNSQTDIAGRIGRQLMTQAELQPQIRAESGNVETLLGLCQRGTGACFCPDNLVGATLTPEQLEQMHILRFGEQAKYMIRFGFLDQYQWSMIQKFIDLALETTEA